MEREAIRDGEERPRGQSVLIPGASPPTDPNRHSCSLKSTKGRGPQALLAQGTWLQHHLGAKPRKAHLTQPQRENYTRQTFSQLPDYIRQ